ncbi:hypothetical protein FRC07_006938 [Ceratobasidium sp. 392]|nr:hypothetical protein FRC07_006938 [Ceratobasidium sp. 392]
MLRVCRGRPVESIHHLQDSSTLTNPLSTHLHPAGASPTRLSLSARVHTTSNSHFHAHAIIVLRILQIAAENGLAIKHFKLTVVGPITNLPLGSAERCGWARSWALLIPTEDSQRQIESLHLAFDPPLTENSLSKQEIIIQTAVHRGLYNLSYAVIGSSEVEWRRHVKGQVNPASNHHLNWTPRPNRGGSEVHCWWLYQSGLDAEKVSENAHHGVIPQLRDLMLAYWDEKSVPSVEELRKSLAWVLSTNKNK